MKNIQDKKLEETIKNLIEDPINKIGYILVDVKLTTEEAYEGKRALVITIDKSNSGKGITIDDCAKVSRRIGKILDKADLIKESYILEVSSPGVKETVTLPEWNEE